MEHYDRGEDASHFLLHSMALLERSSGFPINWACRPVLPSAVPMVVSTCISFRSHLYVMMTMIIDHD